MTDITSPDGGASLPGRERHHPLPSAIGEEEEPLDWRRLAGAVWRFRWLVLAIVVVGSAAGFLASRVVRPRYVAQATIWIDSRGGHEGAQSEMAPLQPERLLDPEAWTDLLQSYIVLDSVVREQRLYLTFKDPADVQLAAGFDLADGFHPGDYALSIDGAGGGYVLRTSDGHEIERGSVGDSIGRSVGLRWKPAPSELPAGRAVAFSVLTPRDASRQLAQQLTVHIDPEGNILRIELEGTAPARIASVVNAIAGRYVAVAAQLKRQKLTEVTGILGQQLQAAQGGLSGAEGELQAFGIRTATLPRAPLDAPTAAGAGDKVSAATTPVVERYFALTARRDQLQQQQLVIQRALGELDSGGAAADALAALPADAGRPSALSQALTELASKQAELRTLRYRYSDNYPAVVQLIADVSTLEHQTIPGLAQQLSAELDAQRRGLSPEVAQAAADLRGIPPRTIEEARLRRSVQLAENLYTELQQRYDEARLAEASAVSDVRVLDAAVPSQKPVKDATLRLLLLGLGGSLGLGIALAAFLDKSDRSVRYPREVSHGMGLSILGAVPHLRSAARGHGGAPLVESTDAVVEALRGIRLSLLYAATPDEPLVLAISSPGSGEGKSFVAANLGLAFAEAGQRTLVVDGDLRRGLLHRRCGLQRMPGLTEAIRETASFETVVRPTAYPGLSLLPCGSRAQNAPELLGGAGMQRLLQKARATHDVIIIDTPPLGACVDPYILATAAGRLAVVLRAGVSEREVMLTKLDTLSGLPVRILGVVLNDVPLETAAYRSYAYHLSGYEAIEEGGSRVVR
ncbi:MAG: polysaccharide biosynthesis tyrosine autokinase [Gemmatimonadales bacterium]